MQKFFALVLRQKKLYRKGMKKSVKIVLITIISIFVVFLIALGFVSSYLVEFSVGRGATASGAISSSLIVSENSDQQTSEMRAIDLQYSLHQKSLLWAEQKVYETLTIKSEDNLNLTGYAFIHDGEEVTSDWAVIVHGFNCIASDFWYYAQVYYEKGFNVFTPDLRASGKSEGKYIGMGWLERRDLIQWINELVAAKGAKNVVLHGFSMGAATIMMATGERDFPSAVKVCIEDAGYTSDWDEMSDKLDKIFHLPNFPILYATSAMTKIKAGYSMKEADSVKQLKKSKTPMLFIHGDQDDYNPFWMLDVVYDAFDSTDKEKLVIKGARHVMGSYVEPELYWNTIWSFIGNYI